MSKLGAILRSAGLPRIRPGRIACALGWLVATTAAQGADGLRARVAAGEDAFQFAAPVAGESREVVLRLQRSRLFSPDAKLMRRGADAVDAPAKFEAAAFTVLRGEVEDAPGGRAVVVVGPTQTTGFVATGGGRYVLDGDADGLTLRPAGAEAGGLPPGVEFCNLVGVEAGSSPQVMADVGTIRRGRRMVELAVDTDYPFRALFADEASAWSYLAALYAEVAAIYARDLDVELIITYMRVWDTPTDPYQTPNPLQSFSFYWQTQMGGVQRDMAQLITARRDLPFTGQANTSSLCGFQAYSAVGFAMGWTAEQGISRWDVVLAAHEGAHVLGALHTHNLGLDNCAPDPGTEQRGSIMSYCNLHNGGIANIDLHIDPNNAHIVAALLSQAACAPRDCNGNGISDATEIAAGSSADVNSDGIPDACEDCDGDGERDDVEIAKGALDLDRDGVPDACDADCDNDGLPDHWAAFRGLAADVDHDGVPDACEEDCDGDGVPDVEQFVTHLDLDVDRNDRLDTCDDCDGDGVTDLAALAGAHTLWVANATTSGLHAYHEVVGTRLMVSGGPLLSGARDLLVAPGGKVLVAAPDGDRIAAFDGYSGAPLPDFVPPGSGGLDGPWSLLFTRQGTLLVSSSGNDAIIEYDGATGAFLRVLVAGGDDLDRPYGMALSPDDKLYVSSYGTHKVLVYDATSGALRGVLVDDPGVIPLKLLLLANGHLLVGDSAGARVWAYDAQTGEFLGAFNGPTSSAGNAIAPGGLRVGPNGNVFISASTVDGEIVEYDAATGGFLQGYVGGPYSGLKYPIGFDFLPGDATDCNFNQVPDACDLAAGRLHDANHDGVPDECALDCDGDGVRDIREILPNGWHYDCNFNGVLDDCELAAGSATDFDGDGLMDACDGDVDGDGAANSRDICAFTPLGTKVRGNGAPYGDGDGDCRVTLADMVQFASCLDAGGGSSVRFDCAAYDFNDDLRVNLADFAGMQRAIGRDQSGGRD